MTAAGIALKLQTEQSTSNDFSQDMELATNTLIPQL